MSSVKVLDVTLRDGGCVIDFNFGQNYMEQILDALEKSGVEIIELGYLDSQKGSESERTQFSNERVISQNFLKSKKKGITYVAMFDYGKFDPASLSPCTSDKIDGIRLAFHKKDRFAMVAAAREILRKGYKLYIQPMVVMRYSDQELLDLINTVNTQLKEAEAFYIVDSFGEMRENDLNRVVHLVDHNLDPGIALGFHSHNNIQLSYANAISFLKCNSSRELLVDSSILGMGKGAGNLSTEIFMEHLNLYYKKRYSLIPLLEVIDKVINTLRAESYWGYSIEYYLSSINHCTPSYAGHFYKKHMLPVEQVSELLGMISEDKKISFDKEYADRLYLTYNARRHYNDDPTIQVLRRAVRGKKVLLIAPGKKLSEADALVRQLLQEPDCISISLNYFDRYETDYVLTSRRDAYRSARCQKKRIITLSSVCDEGDSESLVIDYEKWVTLESGVQDSSGIIALKLMMACGAAELDLVGFDGYTTDVSLNYYEKSMSRPVSLEQAQKRNDYFRMYVDRVRKMIPVRFLTESLYDL